MAAPAAAAPRAPASGAVFSASAPGRRAGEGWDEEEEPALSLSSKAARRRPPAQPADGAASAAGAPEAGLRELRGVKLGIGVGEDEARVDV